MSIKKIYFAVFVFFLLFFFSSCGYNLKGELLISQDLFPIKIRSNLPDFILQNKNQISLQKILEADFAFKNSQAFAANSSENLSETQIFIESQSLVEEELLSTKDEKTTILTMRVLVSVKDKANNVVWNKVDFSARSNFVLTSSNLNLNKERNLILENLAKQLAEQIKLRLTKFDTNI